MKNGKIQFLVPPSKKISLSNEKIKVVQNCLNWRENLSKKIFELFTKKGYIKKLLKMKIWRETWLKPIFGFLASHFMKWR